MSGKPSGPARLLFALAGGVLFGGGLAVSGMIRPEIVLDFLKLRDMGLLLVLGGAAGVAFVVYQSAPRILRGPWLGGSFASRPGKLDRKLIVGAALFGAGWGSAACARARPSRAWARACGRWAGPSPA